MHFIVEKTFQMFHNSSTCKISINVHKKPGHINWLQAYNILSEWRRTDKPVSIFQSA